eukprot:TRINITY_DN13414_c0_g1_i1.p1 TRINITY_DN13414_c0_g1~~TRINITY_DN13414_c0_g1_i1.p1  ORF type:complete len:746 (+),score=181.28 TRINITY_DN13414_c0_g1_i1:273-2240(+)
MAKRHSSPAIHANGVTRQPRASTKKEASPSKAEKSEKSEKSEKGGEATTKSSGSPATKSIVDSGKFSLMGSLDINRLISTAGSGNLDDLENLSPKGKAKAKRSKTTATDKDLELKAKEKKKEPEGFKDRPKVHSSSDIEELPVRKRIGSFKLTKGEKDKEKLNKPKVKRKMKGIRDAHRKSVSIDSSPEQSRSSSMKGSISKEPVNITFLTVSDSDSKLAAKSENSLQKLFLKSSMPDKRTSDNPLPTIMIETTEQPVLRNSSTPTHDKKNRHTSDIRHDRVAPAKSAPNFKTFLEETQNKLPERTESSNLSCDIVALTTSAEIQLPPADSIDNKPAETAQEGTTTAKSTEIDELKATSEGAAQTNEQTKNEAEGISSTNQRKSRGTEDRRNLYARCRATSAPNVNASVNPVRPRPQKSTVKGAYESPEKLQLGKPKVPLQTSQTLSQKDTKPKSRKSSFGISVHKTKTQPNNPNAVVPPALELPVRKPPRSANSITRSSGVQKATSLKSPSTQQQSSDLKVLDPSKDSKSLPSPKSPKSSLIIIPKSQPSPKTPQFPVLDLFDGEKLDKKERKRVRRSLSANTIMTNTTSTNSLSSEAVSGSSFESISSIPPNFLRKEILALFPPNKTEPETIPNHQEPSTLDKPTSTTPPTKD